jgi:hypothetical protein
MTEQKTVASLVRDHMKARQLSTLTEVIEAYPGVEPEKLGAALERLTVLGDVRKMGVIEGKRRDGKRKRMTQYKYVKDSSRAPGPLAHAKNKTLIDVQPRAVRTARSKAIVKAAPSGYEPGHFTAPFRAASEALPDGFPPRFDWDGVRKAHEPLPIAMLQTILRRELDSRTGKGWGGGTSVMPNTPMQARPAFMGHLPGFAA